MLKSQKADLTETQPHDHFNTSKEKMRKPGAAYAGDGHCVFTVWAPQKENMTLHLPGPPERKIPMHPSAEGYFTLELHHIRPGDQYLFLPGGDKAYPDPASHYQPLGVHGPSVVVDQHAFAWSDQAWRGLPLQDLVFYELHVGTFTPEGTFAAIIPRLAELAETGINAIELMPLSQFPGNRNWGYDGVYPYSVHHAYGGPEGLKQLVDACHARGIAVFQDVVYNHLGPEGNYLGQFGPYFTDKYCTPWGEALNFDGDWSDGVRDYFAHNALHWFEHYHLDGLRLDAIHMVFDGGAVHFWEYTCAKVKQLEQKLGRRLYLVAESDLNSPKVVKAPEMGGYGFDGQWLDDFHHALYALLDPKGKERYADFGLMEQLAKAYTDGFVHSGEYVQFRKRRYGTSSAGVPGDKFVVFNQNHDQVGNRVGGERLCLLVDFERLKMAAAAILLAPYVPMLFMGEEYADESPFYYFVSHADPDLIKAVQQGRQAEFAAFGFDAGPPDPQAEKTFHDCKLRWHTRNQGRHRILLAWHRHLIALRRTLPVLQNFHKNDIRAHIIGQQGLVLQRQTEGGREQLLCLFNFSEKKLSYTLPPGPVGWQKITDSTEKEWLWQAEATDTPLPAQVGAGGKIKLPGLSVSVYGQASAQ